MNQICNWYPEFLEEWWIYWRWNKLLQWWGLCDDKKEDGDDVSSSLGMYSAEPGQGGGGGRLRKQEGTSNPWVNIECPSKVSLNLNPKIPQAGGWHRKSRKSANLERDVSQCEPATFVIPEHFKESMVFNIQLFRNMQNLSPHKCKT